MLQYSYPSTKSDVRINVSHKHETYVVTFTERDVAFEYPHYAAYNTTEPVATPEYIDSMMDGRRLGFHKQLFYCGETTLKRGYNCQDTWRMYSCLPAHPRNYC